MPSRKARQPVATIGDLVEALLRYDTSLPVVLAWREHEQPVEVASVVHVYKRDSDTVGFVRINAFRSEGDDA